LLHPFRDLYGVAAELDQDYRGDVRSVWVAPLDDRLDADVEKLLRLTLISRWTGTTPPA
jgi:hypothetical protein